MIIDGPPPITLTCRECGATGKFPQGTNTHSAFYTLPHHRRCQNHIGNPIDQSLWLLLLAAALFTFAVIGAGIVYGGCG